ncbi:MAG TPA: hypothetical protein ACFYED_00020 [Candidatus Tripitaka californicus]|uniref:hypothetical protein n=1 Tax=Candidatus Tripitaka californicus TaxID=3367616 RepID=UPI004027972C
MWYEVGYRKAMNSPTVRALLARLRVVGFRTKDYLGYDGETLATLAAYEKDLGGNTRINAGELEEKREWAESLSSPTDRFNALDLLAKVGRLQALLAEVRHRTISDFWTGTTGLDSHYWICRLCTWHWRDGQSEAHEPGCPNQEEVPDA